MSSKPVTFLNYNGLKLFGVVDFPDSCKHRPIPIIILSPGIKSRVAPHRLYVKLARHFSAMGFIVLRFDFSGLGDSEGILEEAMLADFYGTVQLGRYVGDTRAAMDWMQNEYKVSRFILCGLCGGAITGLLTGSQDLRVDSLVGFGIPVILDGSQVDHTKYLTNQELRVLRKGYISKLMNFKSWLNFLTFKSDYKIIIKALFNSKKLNTADAEIVTTSSANIVSNFNSLLPSACEKMISSRKLLLIFSEADRLYSNYQEKFAQPYRTMLKNYQDNLEIYLVKDANHIFSFTEWQNDLQQKITLWLNKNY